MKKNKLSFLVKRIPIIFFLALIFLSGCEAEKDFTTNTISEDKLIVKHCSMKDANLQSDSKLRQAVNQLKSLHSKTNARLVVDEISGLLYDDEKGIYVAKDGKESYNFPIIQEDSNEKIKNITFNKNADNDYDVYIVKYDYTKEDIQNFSNETLSQREIKYYPLIKDKMVYTGYWEICITTITTTATWTEEHEGYIYYCSSVSESTTCESGGGMHDDGTSWTNGGIVGNSGNGGSTTGPVNNTGSDSILSAAVIDDEPAPERFPCLTAAKLLEIFPNASLPTRVNLAKTIRIYGGYFDINTKEKLQHFLAQIGAETDGLTHFSGEDMNYSTPQFIVNNWPGKFSFTDPTKANPNNYLHNEVALANLAYAFQIGNGDEASGDGWLHRGRGFIQLTGRGNYEGYHAYLTSIGLGNWYQVPDNVSTNLHSVLSAMWFFKSKVLDKIIIDENTTVKKVTKKINPKLKALDKRENYFETAKIKINC